MSNDKQNEYEVVITGGRVIDPETGFDAVRNVGLQANTHGRNAMKRTLNIMLAIVCAAALLAGVQA